MTKAEVMEQLQQLTNIVGAIDNLDSGKQVELLSNLKDYFDDAIADSEFLLKKNISSQEGNEDLGQKYGFYFEDQTKE